MPPPATRNRNSPFVPAIVQLLAFRTVPAWLCTIAHGGRHAFFACGRARPAVSYESRSRGATRAGEAQIMPTATMRSGLFQHNPFTLFFAGALAVLLFHQG